MEHHEIIAFLRKIAEPVWLCIAIFVTLLHLNDSPGKRSLVLAIGAAASFAIWHSMAS